MSTWYNLKAEGKRAAIELDGPIADFEFWGDEVTSRNFVADLNAAGSVDEIDVFINSPGGVVTEGLAIYNALKNHKAKITVHVRGLAASMASIIAMVGDEIVMPEASFLMIHRVWGGAFGNPDQIKKEAAVMEKLESKLVEIYVERTGLAEDSIRAMIEAETWLTGSEAVEQGFATRLDDSSDDSSASAALKISPLTSAFLMKNQISLPEGTAVRFRDPAPAPAAGPVDPKLPVVAPNNAPAPPADDATGEEPKLIEKLKALLNRSAGEVQPPNPEPPAPETGPTRAELLDENTTLKNRVVELEKEQADAIELVAAMGLDADDLDDLPPVAPHADDGAQRIELEARIADKRQELEASQDPEKSTQLLAEVKKLRTQLRDIK